MYNWAWVVMTPHARNKKEKLFFDSRTATSFCLASLATEGTGELTARYAR